jgi:hypothetical protein
MDALDQQEEEKEGIFSPKHSNKWDPFSCDSNASELSEDFPGQRILNKRECKQFVKQSQKDQKLGLAEIDEDLITLSEVEEK